MLQAVRKFLPGRRPHVTLSGSGDFSSPSPVYPRKRHPAPGLVDLSQQTPGKSNKAANRFLTRRFREFDRSPVHISAEHGPMKWNLLYGARSYLKSSLWVV